MSEIQIGLILLLITFIVLLSGMPIAFGLTLISVSFLLIFGDPGALSAVALTFIDKLSSFALLAVPMFIFVGAAIGMSPAGKDIYESLHRWLHRFPGGLVIANILGCGLFSAMTGSSPATAATIGKVGIPEMIKRGVSSRLASGSIAAGGTLGILIPPSITLIVYGIVTQTSVARLFLAGVIPGLLLIVIFSAYAWFVNILLLRKRGVSDRVMESYTMSEKIHGLIKVLPFLVVIASITFFMYGGFATPSEVSAIAAFIVLILVSVIYKKYKIKDVWPIMESTARDTTMVLLIVASAALYAYMMSYLYITQSVADWVFEFDLNTWQLLLCLNLFLLFAGLFLPPISVILMAMPIIHPVLVITDIDLIWFAIMLTVNLEIGLLTPPLGLNLFVIKGVAPNVSMKDIMLGALPFVFLMLSFIVLICVFPSIVTWLPDFFMGPEL